jgi:hypothetical protein
MKKTLRLIDLVTAIERSSNAGGVGEEISVMVLVVLGASVPRR